MRTFNLAPLYRSTVGFDRVFSLLDQLSGFDGAAPGYPPYNIERTGENAYRISVAVAGFSEPELTIVTKENTLTIRGDKQAKTDEKNGNVLHVDAEDGQHDARFYTMSRVADESLRWSRMWAGVGRAAGVLGRLEFH